ncbi:transcription termination factor 5, mitochondrial [Chelonus insularis]|uniref:transcription termination factor 5, mitochondrial n=1 Tax=Chelonus insularis TaxID=460826 RepID=UPI00158A33BF|nr:transcription termination factor 5, mitochondrial [Chelonus insularis]
MLLSNTFKVLLRSVKHDELFFAIKWYSKNSDNGVDIKKFPNLRIYKELIMKTMYLNNQQAIEFLKENTHVFRVPPHKIVEINKLCQSYRVNMNHRYKGNLELFSLDKNEIETRIFILREIGVENIVPVMLNNSIQHVNLKLFRVFAQINEHIDMGERLYSFLLEPSTLMPPFKNLDENVSIKTYRYQCLSHYFQWRLKIPPEEKLTIDKLVTNTIGHNFAKLRKSFSVLHEVVGIPIDLMRNPFYLKYCSPDDLICIIERIKTICNVPIIELIQSTPTLCGMDYKNVVVIKHLLEKNKYSEEQLRNCPKVLLADSDEVTDILNIINQRADFRIFHNHPQILDIYLLEDEFKLRMGYLKYLNIQTASVSLFKKPTLAFDKITRSGKFTFDINEIYWIIKKFLSIDKQEVIHLLKKHPFWNKIDLLIIYETLQFLTSFFDVNAIKNNFTVVLYSRAVLEEVLIEIINTHHVCSFENPYTTTQILALCEYEIEKNYHFTGDGVWEKPKKISNSSNLSLHLKTILMDETNRKNMFKNNPYDYFSISQYKNDNFNNYNKHNQCVNKIHNNNDNYEETNEAHNCSHNHEKYYDHKYRNEEYNSKLQLNSTNKT